MVYTNSDIEGISLDMCITGYIHINSTYLLLHVVELGMHPSKTSFVGEISSDSKEHVRGSHRLPKTKLTKIQMVAKASRIYVLKCTKFY